MSRILIIGILAGAMALAQRGSRLEDPSGGIRAQPPGQFDQFAAKLKLDKEQRAEAEKIVDGAREAMGAAQQKLMDARRNLAAALIVGQSSDVVDKLTKDYTSLTAQAKALETTAFGKICALLKPNQQSKAVPNFGLMAQLVEQGQTGGGQRDQWGGGRGGQGGR